MSRKFLLGMTTGIAMCVAVVAVPTEAQLPGLLWLLGLVLLRVLAATFIEGDA